jgi:hypothetical protein
MAEKLAPGTSPMQCFAFFAAQAGADGFDSKVYLANRLENKTNMSESKTRNYSGTHSKCHTVSLSFAGEPANACAASTEVHCM